MPRSVYVWRDGRLVELDPNYSPEPRIHLITDTMPSTWHPCDGRYYDSKSAFRLATKVSGGVEVGNEKLPERKKYKPQGVRESIKRAIEKVEQKPKEVKLESISDWSREVDGRGK